MTKICRHFKALNRKNLILYKRTPSCAIFEILLPAALMCIMVWLRTMVHVKHTDLTSLAKYRHPVFPGLSYPSEKKSWQWDPVTTTAFEQSFMTFMNYHPRSPIPTPGQEALSSESH